MAFSEKLLPIEPLNFPSKVVAGFCYENGVPFSINIDKLRKGKISHEKCVPSAYDSYKYIEKYKKKAIAKNVELVV